MASWIRPCASAGRIARAVERGLLPAGCLGCGRQNAPSDGEALVCALCRSRWRPVPDPQCSRCGEPRSRNDPGCRVCRDWPEGLARVRSAVWLTERARRTVHLLKFDGWWRVADSMAVAMRALEPLTDRLLLVPIPLGRKRLRARGYNQSACLARALARSGGAPVDEGALRRVRETEAQSTLPPEARLANIRGAFRAGGVRGRRVVVVDDVFTTGSTVVSAAEALLAGGAEAVDAVTFARAQGPLDQALA